MAIVGPPLPLSLLTPVLSSYTICPNPAQLATVFHSITGGWGAGPPVLGVQQRGESGARVRAQNAAAVP